MRPPDPRSSLEILLDELTFDIDYDTMGGVYEIRGKERRWAAIRAAARHGGPLAKISARPPRQTILTALVLSVGGTLIVEAPHTMGVTNVRILVDIWRQITPDIRPVLILLETPKHPWPEPDQVIDLDDPGPDEEDTP